MLDLLYHLIKVPAHSLLHSELDWSEFHVSEFRVVEVVPCPLEDRRLLFDLERLVRHVLVVSLVTRRAIYECLKVGSSRVSLCLKDTQLLHE